jgi:hypothetical protein
MELSMKLSRLEGLAVQGNEPPQNLDPRHKDFDIFLHMEWWPDGYMIPTWNLMGSGMGISFYPRIRTRVQNSTLNVCVASGYLLYPIQTRPVAIPDKCNDPNVLKVRPILSSWNKVTPHRTRKAPPSLAPWGHDRAPTRLAHYLYTGSAARPFIFIPSFSPSPHLSPTRAAVGDPVVRPLPAPFLFVKIFPKVSLPLFRKCTTNFASDLNWINKLGLC